MNAWPRLVPGAVVTRTRWGAYLAQTRWGWPAQRPAHRRPASSHPDHPVVAVRLLDLERPPEGRLHQLPVRQAHRRSMKGPAVPMYRKKPVVIEARLVDRDSPTFDDVVNWCGGTRVAYVDSSPPAGTKVAFVDTLEGRMFADQGDYMIKGVKGEFYPCKPDIFAATYEEAS